MPNAYRSNCYSFCNSYPSLAGSAFVRGIHHRHYFQLLSSYVELLEKKPVSTTFNNFARYSLFNTVRTRYPPSRRIANFPERDDGSHFMPPLSNSLISCLVSCLLTKENLLLSRISLLRIS